jgi:hypothetical protein
MQKILYKAIAQDKEEEEDQEEAMICRLFIVLFSKIYREHTHTHTLSIQN